MVYIAGAFNFCDAVEQLSLSSSWQKLIMIELLTAKGAVKKCIMFEYAARIIW